MLAPSAPTAMRTESPAMSYTFRLRSHYRWSTAVLLAVSALALLGYAAWQVSQEYRYQRLQQSHELDRTQQALERALHSAIGHVQNMRQLGEAHWSGDLARSASASADTLKPFESLAQAGAPWDRLPVAMSRQWGAVFLDPSAGDSEQRVQSFKAMVVAVMPLVAARHAQDRYLQSSYLYDAQGSVVAMYPPLSQAQYLSMLGVTDMRAAQAKVFEADGMQPLRWAGPRNNPQRGPVWTSPHVAAGGRGMVVTLLLPLYEANRLLAVAGTDVALEHIDELLMAHPVSHSRLWVVDERGVVVASTHGQRHRSERVSLADLAVPLTEADALRRPVSPAQWTLVADAPVGALWWAALVRAQGAVAAALGCLALIGVLLRLQRQRVVGPALRLAQFVQDVSEDPDTTIPPVPPHWKASFTQVAASARERQAMVEAITRKTEELERRVTERTRDLTALNQRLRQAKAEAEASSAAKSAFLASMSHEIRTPIHAIAGMTYLLSEADLSPRQKEYVDEVIKANKHLLRLLNAVLDLAKIEAGKLELDSAPFDLDHVLGNVRSLFTQEMRQKGITFEVLRLDKGPVALVGDALRLTQVLVNLVNNASKFTEVGSVRVLVSCDHSEWGKTRLKLEVQDTGIGLSQQQIQRLFKPFTQADKHTSRRYGGTGLGLTITKAFIDAMGGRIGVKSAPGQGATFVVDLTLPRHTESFSPASTTPMPLEIVPGFSGKRVLLAEDNPVNQRIAQEILQREHLQVDLVCDGEQAVQRCKERRYDLVLMDVQMPQMDGMQATRLIRQLGVTTPIIAMTANTTLQDRNECLQVGMSDFLGKPFSPVAFVNMIKKWLVQTPDTELQALHAPSK